MSSPYDDKLFKGANAKTFENARALRRVCTEAEGLLWQQLRNRKLLGLKFRRQHPLSCFVADFYCSEKHVVIEVDGGVHNSESAKQHDEARTRELENMGIQVLRFTNEEVQTQMSVVLKRITQYINNEKQSPL